MQILDNVYAISLRFVNVYLIRSDEGLALIDTGIPGSEKKIITEIGKAGWSIRDLKKIFITHSDPDHSGSIAALKSASGARVFASRQEALAISKGESSRKNTRKGLFNILRSLLVKLMRVAPVTVDEIIKEGDEYPILGGLKVLETSGHTPGHCSFYSSSFGVLFCGDSAVSASNGLHPSRPDFTWNREKAMTSYERQVLLKPLIVCCGHGPVLRSPDIVFNNP
jgi:glyoxylase-like metal-dependent hydrolase (beta-lactamase superfamily II)